MKIQYIKIDLVRIKLELIINPAMSIKPTAPVMSDKNIFEFTENSRRIVTPTPLEEQEIERLKRRRVLDDIELNVLNKSSVIFDNQRLAAARICAELVSATTFFVLLVALTQSGKTGTMVGLIKQFLLTYNNYTPVQNIIVITGLSSREWKTQTTERIPDGIRVLHRNDLNNELADELKQAKNVLIIIDEVNIACQARQTLEILFKRAGFQNIKELTERDIKIVEVSATPDGVLYNLSNSSWLQHTKIIKSEPGIGYTGVKELLEQNRIFQFEDLKGVIKGSNKIRKSTIDHIKKLKNIIDNFTSPRYHLIRIPGGDTVINSNLHYVFGDQNYEYLRYDQQSNCDDLQHLLITVPMKHTFVLIKEKLRCAVTLAKLYLGILHERYVGSPSDSTIIQGFAGRICGYDTNNDSIIFTNKPSIERYIAAWNSDFKDHAIAWRSKTTYFSRIDNKTVGRRTFNHHGLFIKSGIDERKERYIVFTNFSDLRNNFRNSFIRVPDKFTRLNVRKPIIDQDVCLTIPQHHIGFYSATIKKTKKVWGEQEIKDPTTWKGASNNGYWVYPCYTDVNNVETLNWYLISKCLKPELSEIFEEKK